jgi:tetratricopeptide (TPR) repeat protein
MPTQTSDTDATRKKITQLRGEIAQQLSASAQDAAAADRLLTSSAELIKSCRWEGQSDEARAILRDLARLFPDDAQNIRITAATIKMQSGEPDAGLADIEREAAAMNRADGLLVRGMALGWLQRFDEAEECLRSAVSLDALSEVERVEAEVMLIRLCAIQKRLDEADQAWKRLDALDPDLAAQMLPVLIRFHIYWYDYSGAQSLTTRLPHAIGRRFFTTLIDAKQAPGLTRQTWDWVADDLYNVDIAQNLDEYVEAALRNASPDLALKALGNVGTETELDRDRMMFIGLAHAQKRNVEGARWALDAALVLAEFEPVRRTRAGADDRRILDAEARIRYGEIPIDPDVRDYLDAYFMPKPHIELVYDNPD